MVGENPFSIRYSGLFPPGVSRLKISGKCIIFEADFALTLQVVIASFRVGWTEPGGSVTLQDCTLSLQ